MGAIIFLYDKKAYKPYKEAFLKLSQQLDQVLTNIKEKFPSQWKEFELLQEEHYFLIKNCNELTDKKLEQKIESLCLLWEKESLEYEKICEKIAELDDSSVPELSSLSYGYGCYTSSSGE